MSWNNFNNYANQGYQPFGVNQYSGYANNGYQMQQPQTRQPQQTQYQELPFREVRYGTIDEAKAHIVMPNQAVMFINRNLNEFYIKSANGMGEPLVETFKYSKLENNSTETQTTNFDPNLFVKTEQLEQFVNSKGFLTKNDIEQLQKQIEVLSKQVNITQMLKENNKDGNK